MGWIGWTVGGIAALWVVLALRTRFVAPVPARSDVRDIRAVRRFVRWLVARDELVRPVAFASSRYFFDEGLRPVIPVGSALDGPDGGDEVDPEFRMVGLIGQLLGSENLAERTADPVEWFTTKLYLDLYVLQGRDEAAWRGFLDRLLDAGSKTLIATFEMSSQLGVDPRNWQDALARIPDAATRTQFLGALVTDNFIGAEARALARCYYEYFGTYFVPAHQRVAASDQGER